MHWACKYIGKPWKSGGFGPDAYNCYGLVHDIYQKRFGIVLPKLLISESDTKTIGVMMKNHPARKGFIEIQEPKEGDIVIMNDYHCGLVIAPDQKGIIHAYKAYGGVVFQKLAIASLQWQLCFIRKAE